MGQAFFTLSLGIAAMEIFGSQHRHASARLTGEAVNVTALDTLVAILAGLIIFPACFAYGVHARTPARRSCSSRCRCVFEPDAARATCGVRCSSCS